MNLNALHRRLLRDVLEIGNAFSLADDINRRLYAETSVADEDEEFP